MSSLELVKAVREAALPLTGAVTDYDPLLQLLGDARFVLLGEASHGTARIYRARGDHQAADREKNFTAIAVEADWPDAYRVSRYVRGASREEDSNLALAGFRRFPVRMWRNADVLEFVDWLRARNAAARSDQIKFGFYCLDLYSLFGSIEAVLGYATHVFPETGALETVAELACDWFEGHLFFEQE